MSEIRFPTLDTGPMSEEQKQMIANMAELRDGKYSVMVEQKDAQGFKTGIMEEKAITELSEEDIKTLSESSKPKQLEDIAKEQLTALNRIANSLNSMATAPKAGLMNTPLVKSGRQVMYNAGAELAKNTQELIKPADMKNLMDNMSVNLKEFMIKNHIQGYVNSSIRIGLYYNNELVSLMTLGKTRNILKYKSVDGEYEILRFSNKLNTSVIGGASKIFNYFLKTYKPNKVISYSDKRWSKGGIYKTLGFKLEKISEPNYYYDINKKRETIYKYQKHKLSDMDLLINDSFYLVSFYCIDFYFFSHSNKILR
jgi:hypothetical protein